MSLDMIWQQYGLDELEQGLQQLFPDNTFSFEAVFNRILEGDIPGAIGELFRDVLDLVIVQAGSTKSIFGWLILLGVISTLVSHFSDIFEKRQLADLSFYFMYLFLITILMKSFQAVAASTTSAMENITLFMKLLVPTYLLAVGVAQGTVTAGATCQLMLFIVYGIETILTQGLLPMIESFFLLVLLNGIWMEEKLSLLLEFLEKGIRFVLKGALGVVTGISVFQALITPVIDTARSSVIEKMIKSIPGVGNLTGNVVELTLGSAIVIKNSIGVVLLLLLLLLCAGPLIKIGITACIIKCAAAIMGVMSDKRIVTCTDKAGDAGLLLFRTTGTSMLLFFIAIAVVTASGR